jgi:hypothetical protein
MRIRFPLTAISIAMLPVLHACVDTTKSPAVGQAELAPLTGATWVLTDAKAVGGRALKLSPRTGASLGFIPGASPVRGIAVRLRLDGCPADTALPYTLNFKAGATGSSLVQLGAARTLASTEWTTVTVSEGLGALSQQGTIDLRQLAHTNTSLASTCGIAIDQGTLSANASVGFANATGAGKPRFFLRTNGETDAWMDAAANRGFNAAHYQRAEVHRPHADQYLPWFGGGLVYFKSHAPNGFDIPDASWILKDAAGTPARVAWSGGQCAYCQPALDIGNPALRTFLIGKAKEALAGPNGQSFKGLWVDDVNMTLGLVSPTGQPLTPFDPRTGAPMTDANWQRYMAEWMEALRAALPATVEIYHNSKYYWGSEAYSIRQIKAATGIHIEGGFTDGGLGNDPWAESPYSVAALGRYIARAHTQGKSVIVDNYPDGDAMRNYSLAAFHVFSGTADMLAANTGNRPTDWWAGYDMDLGAPTAAAPTVPQSSGLWRRDFANGIALMVQPTGQAQSITLPRAMVDTNGNVQTTVFLNPREGAVLVNLPSGGQGPKDLVKPKTFTF